MENGIKIGIKMPFSNIKSFNELRFINSNEIRIKFDDIDIYQNKNPELIEDIFYIYTYYDDELRPGCDIYLMIDNIDTKCKIVEYTKLDNKKLSDKELEVLVDIFTKDFVEDFTKILPNTTSVPNGWPPNFTNVYQSAHKEIFKNKIKEFLKETFDKNEIKAYDINFYLKNIKNGVVNTINKLYSPPDQINKSLNPVSRVYEYFNQMDFLFNEEELSKFRDVTKCIESNYGTNNFEYILSIGNSMHFMKYFLSLQPYTKFVDVPASLLSRLCDDKNNLLTFIDTSTILNNESQYFIKQLIYNFNDIFKYLINDTNTNRILILDFAKTGVSLQLFVILFYFAIQKYIDDNNIELKDLSPILDKICSLCIYKNKDTKLIDINRETCSTIYGKLDKFGYIYKLLLNEDHGIKYISCNEFLPKLMLYNIDFGRCVISYDPSLWKTAIRSLYLDSQTHNFGCILANVYIISQLINQKSKSNTKYQYQELYESNKKNIINCN